MQTISAKAVGLRDPAIPCANLACFSAVSSTSMEANAAQSPSSVPRMPIRRISVVRAGKILSLVSSLGRKSMVSSSIVPLTVVGSRSAASMAFKLICGREVLEALLQRLIARTRSSACIIFLKFARNLEKSM